MQTFHRNHLKSHSSPLCPCSDFDMAYSFSSSPCPSHTAPMPLHADCVGAPDPQNTERVPNASIRVGPPKLRLRSTSHSGTSKRAEFPFEQRSFRRQRRHSEASSRLTLLGQRGLRKTVSDILMDRLRTGGVNTWDLHPALLNHCLPDDCAPLDWETILYTPLQASDYVLSKALNLRLATDRELLPQGGQTIVLYVRSFQLTKKQLSDVIAQFDEAGIKTDTTDTWSQCTYSLNSDDKVYIRYVGMTERSSLLRHRHDIAFSSIKSGFLTKFLQALKRTHPLVIDAVTVYELPGVSIRCFREQKEQVLIALLGLPSLVNQRLCEARSFTPTEAHQRAFSALKTDTFSALSSSHFQSVDSGLIARWATEIQSYTRAHKLSVSRSMRQTLEFSEALRLAIFRQAHASMFHGKFVIFLTLGAEMSLDAWRNSQGFFYGNSDSACLMKDYLRRLWSWETGKPVVDKHLDMLLSKGVLPFINLSPWLKAEGEDLQQALRFAKNYLLATKPMIIFTLGAKASSGGAAGFNHPFGYSASQRFDEKVGKLHLIDYEGIYSIQIATFHPGKGRFCRNPGTFSRIFDMTLWILLLTISICVNSREMFESHTRKAWCQYIKIAVEDRLQDSGICHTLESLKEKLRSERPGPQSILTFRGRLSTEILAGDLTVRIISYHRALKNP